MLIHSVISQPHAYERLPAMYSIFVLFVAVHLGMDTSIYIRKIDGKIKNYKTWVAVVASTVGLGIWIMHFLGTIAMYQFQSVRIDLVISTVSILPSFMAGLTLFHAGSKRDLSPMNTAFLGSIYGVFIYLMHHIGMKSLQLPEGLTMGMPDYRISVALSVLLGVTAFAAIHLFNMNLKLTRSLKLVLAIIVSVCTSLIHYISMELTHVVNSMSDTLESHTVNDIKIYYGTMVVSILLSLEIVVLSEFKPQKSS